MSCTGSSGQRKLAYLVKTTGVAEPAEIQLAPNGSEFDLANSLKSNSADSMQQGKIQARQLGAPEDLKVVSWAPHQALANLGGYVYDDQWRIKPIVYIIDSGVDTTSQGRQLIDRRYQDFQLGIDRWLYSPNVTAEGRTTPTDDNPNSHGSCVLSKAIGISSGVYKNKIGPIKNSEVVVVKFARSPSFGEILWAFSIINTDIRNRRKDHPVVVAYAWTSYNVDPIPWSIIKTYFEQIFDQGGIIVVPSGNNATTPGRQDVDTLPAMWESPAFPLIVVGAVNDTGIIPPFSQGPTHVTVWAPGVGVQCARRYGFYHRSGTSHATGMVGFQVTMTLPGVATDVKLKVTGLSAYLLALGRVRFVRNRITPTILKNRLLDGTDKAVSYRAHIVRKLHKLQTPGVPDTAKPPALFEQANMLVTMAKDIETTIVIVPGAWHPALLYEELVSQLRTAGYSAIVAAYPSCDSQSPKTATCDQDAKAIRRQCLSLMEDEGKGLLLVCHSFGGIPGGAAAHGLSKEERLQKGEKGGIIGLVYMTAFVVAEGSSVLEFLGGKHAPFLVPNTPSEGMCIASPAIATFVHDIDEHTASRLATALVPQALLALESPAPPPAWAETAYEGKRAYLKCALDRALPPFIQDKFVKDSGVSWDMRDVDAGHEPHLSQLEKVCEMILGFVEAFLGSKNVTA
ncbi:MAG: hypothetical protein Q9198_003064 [Flavoplaca austrocitrina]